MKTILRKTLRNVFSMSALMAAAATWGQVTLPASSPYSENFNTTPGAAGTAYPSGWTSYNGTTADNAMVVGTAASASGANYNYGSRIGILGSGSAFSPSSVVLNIAGTTGKTDLVISYDVIKIREQARSNSFNLEISTTSATTGFTAVTGGTYASGTIAEGTVTPYANVSLSALDNTSGNIWIRWSYAEVSGSGSRDGIALDNVVLSWSSAPVLAAPVATAASAVTANSFEANWQPVTGASGYRLDVSTSPSFSSASPVSDLFFSEYVEGSGTNKYLEIYNGTGAAVNLGDYRVRLYSNGSTAATGSANDVQLSGTLANGATVVLKNTTATLYTGAATIVASINFNGDDAIALYKISTSSNVDIFGRIGEDPGVAWTSPSNSTLDKTLIRKPSVTGGVTVNPASGFPTLETEWTVANLDDVANLGMHTFVGGTNAFVPGYQDLAVSSTSQVVSGLAASTQYYYRVRAVAAAVTSTNSNVITVNTTVNTSPVLTATALADFGSVCIETVGTPVLFTISGSNLVAGDITVGPLDGYTFSETATGTFADSLTVAQTGGTFTHDLYVQFAPVVAGPYNGNITVSGGGATSFAAAVTGTGVNSSPTVVISSVTSPTSSTSTILSEVTAQGCSEVLERGIVYALTASPELLAPNTTQVDSGSGTGAFTVNLTELVAGTTYHIRAYAINNGDISYSADVAITTVSLVAPVAVAATAVGSDTFTANWNEVEGAVSYRLDVSESATFGTATLATDLFFSEYVEGSASNKYIEIYNGTGAAVDLTDYRVRLYANGATTATNDVQLTGSLANGATLVLKNSAATLYTGTATAIASINFNGDDAIALYKISTTANVDIFGRIGEDPGSAWTSTANSTLDKTLVRKSTVAGGVTVNPASGFPTLDSEWEVLPIDTVSGLGSHTFSGVSSSFVPGYENLTVTDTTQIVTDLNPGVTYYYRVRAVAGNASANSNVVIVETTTSTEISAQRKANAVLTDNKVMVYKQNGAIAISSANVAVKSVTVFDVNGRLLFNSGAFNTNDVILSDINAVNQVLIIKTVTADNKTVTNKIVH